MSTQSNPTDSNEEPPPSEDEAKSSSDQNVSSTIIINKLKEKQHEEDVKEAVIPFTKNQCPGMINSDHNKSCDELTCCWKNPPTAMPVVAEKYKNFISKIKLLLPQEKDNNNDSVGIKETIEKTSLLVHNISIANQNRSKLSKTCSFLPAPSIDNNKNNIWQMSVNYNNNNNNSQSIATTSNNKNKKKKLSDSLEKEKKQK